VDPFRIFDFRFWIFDWGQGLSANFANYREFCGRGIFTTEDGAAVKPQTKGSVWQKNGGRNIRRVSDKS
jgi:hypothetical protein